ncbi:hypothetical protein MYX82_13965 [Acidobacteria bacterium AH-259-D05]|nr:hypothetical protein [Acidobacteria bacterium AH-259-D05]
MKRFLVLSVFLLGLSGVFLWSQEWQHVAVLASDVAGGETMLTVDWVSSGTEGQDILIESRDGSMTEMGTIRHIYGNHIVLKGTLKNNFLAGSRLYQ